MTNDSYNKILSRNLKAIRRSKGLTTVDLAKILGVSQAKISYIEHCKGILSARDVAVLARRLDVPVTEFFRGLDQSENGTAYDEAAGHLAHYGAKVLAKASGVLLKEVPFEDVIGEALGFAEDDRLHKGFCAAMIIQAASKEINIDRIFALIGNNPYLVARLAHEAETCISVINALASESRLRGHRAKRQIEKLITAATSLSGGKRAGRDPSSDEIEDLAEFVKECLDAKG